MSKAFTRESEHSEDDPPIRLRDPLPPGVKNYITAAGARRMEEELAALVEARQGQENPRRDARIRQLREVIGSFVIAEPPSDREVIRFGAAVTVERGGTVEKYRLVGVDETDIEANAISWLSPLARALIGRRGGEAVRFRAPSGMEEIRIVSVDYD